MKSKIALIIILLTLAGVVSWQLISMRSSKNRAAVVEAVASTTVSVCQDEMKLKQLGQLFDLARISLAKYPDDAKNAPRLVTSRTADLAYWTKEFKDVTAKLKKASTTVTSTGKAYDAILKSTKATDTQKNTAMTAASDAQHNYYALEKELKGVEQAKGRAESALASAKTELPKYTIPKGQKQSPELIKRTNAYMDADKAFTEARRIPVCPRK